MQSFIHQKLLAMVFLLAFLLITIESVFVYGMVSLPEPQQSLLNSKIALFQQKANGYNQKQTKLFPGASYDFIVIGSGPGGSTVANRLSENENWSVLLLEAGEEESVFSLVPGWASILPFTDYNWNFATERQPGSCLGFNGGQCPWPRGKALGGSSTINFMLYFRGVREDYDDWYDLGNQGWSYEDVLPYFIKSENAQSVSLANEPYHGVGGELSVQHGHFKPKTLEGFMKAADEMGYTYTDYNSGHIGEQYSEAQYMINGSVRASAARAFLKPAKDRLNLDIATKILALKVLINPITKTAYGVTVYSLLNGLTFDVYAKKEVIISAGALQSPQLLMLSGLGPKWHLEELGIEVLQDLPGVGQNLLDHPSYASLVFTVNQTGVTLTADPLAPLTYILTGEGSLSVPPSGGAYVFTKTKYHYPHSDPRPDLEILYNSGSSASNRLTPLSNGLPDETYDEVFKPYENTPTFSMIVTLYQAKSIGYIKLRSNDPFESPKFYANYFDVEEDLDKLVEGVKFAIEMTQTDALQKFGTQVEHLNIKACENFEPGSNEYWKCAIRQFPQTLYHQVGTCKMGPETDSFAVVSSELKVYGVNRLRVIDASIMPTLPCAHTTAPTIMIAEKASDQIKEEWGRIDENHEYLV